MLYNFEKKSFNFYTLVSAKCNGIIKFSLSLKMKKKKRAPVPPPKCLFSVQPVFLSTYKKTFETNMCDLQVLFKTFFSKMYNKEKLFIAVLFP